MNFFDKAHGKKSSPKPPSAILPEEFCDLLLSITANPENKLNAELPKILTGGSIIQLEHGKQRIIFYSQDLINHCVNTISSLSNYDANWCERYTELLTQVITIHSSVANRLRCLGVYAMSAINQGRIMSVIRSLENALQNLETVENSDVYEDLGHAGIVAGQQAQFNGQMDQAELAFQLTAQLTKDHHLPLYSGVKLSLGVLASMNQNWDHAKKYLSEACVLLEKQGDIENFSTSLMELASVQIQIGQHLEARRNLLIAEEICEKLETSDNYTALPHCLSNLVEVGIQLGDVSDSELLKILDRAQSLSESRNDPGLMNVLLKQRQKIIGESDVRLNFKRLFHQVKASYSNNLWAALDADYQNALESLNRSILSEAPTRLENMALFAAIKAYVRLVYASQFEVLRHNIRNDNLDNKQNLENSLIRLIVRLLLNKGEADWAMEFIDRSKSRSLLYLWQLAHLDSFDLFQTTNVDSKIVEEIQFKAQTLSEMIHMTGLDGSADERSLHLQMSELLQQLPEEMRESLMLDLVYEDYEDLQREIRAWEQERQRLDANQGNQQFDKPYTRKTYLASLTIQNVASLLEPGECIIEYYFYDTDGYALILVPDGKVYPIELDISSDRIRELVQWINFDPQKPGSSGALEDWNPILGELYNGLIRPLLPHLANLQVKRMVIVPHGDLYNLPFAPLWDQEQQRYLIEDFEISIAISAHFFALMRRTNKKPALQIAFAGFADAVQSELDELPNAINELDSVLAIIPPGAKIIGVAKHDDLTHHRFVSFCEQANVIHYAGHVIFLQESPLDSYIPLVGNTTLPDIRKDDHFTCAQMMKELHLNADLFFFNGCESGRMNLKEENEIVGFLRALTFLGASRIIYTLWPISDTSETVSVVTKFYQYYFDDPQNCATALRRAMLSLKDLHPWFWAGFQATGT